MPQLPIERIVRRERGSRPDTSPRLASAATGGQRLRDQLNDLLALGPSPETAGPGERIEDCSCPRGGGWRPGARWALGASAQAPRLREAEGALVTYARTGNRDLLTAACRRARALGLAPGMPLAKARVMVRGLDATDVDLILDFSRAEGDRIDLHNMDADETQSGFSDFTFTTHASTAAGTVWLGRAIGGMQSIFLNVDGGTADFEIRVDLSSNGGLGLAASDFLL